MRDLKRSDSKMNEIEVANKLKKAFNLLESVEDIIKIIKKENSSENIINVGEVEYGYILDDFNNFISDKHFTSWNIREYKKFISNNELIKDLVEKRKEITYKIMGYYLKKHSDNKKNLEEKIFLLAGFSPCPNCVGKVKE